MPMRWPLAFRSTFEPTITPGGVRGEYVPCAFIQGDAMPSTRVMRSMKGIINEARNP